MWNKVATYSIIIVIAHFDTMMLTLLYLHRKEICIDLGDTLCEFFVLQIFQQSHENDCGKTFAVA